MAISKGDDKDVGKGKELTICPETPEFPTISMVPALPAA